MFEILDLQVPYDKIPKKISGKTWFSHFSQLRNKKAHGALLPSICGKASEPLEKSLKIVIENFYLFKREWVYLYQNMSGKYRVTNLNIKTDSFDQLRSDDSFVSKYLNGVYTYFDERTLVDFINSTPEATDFYFPNGNFRDKTYEMLSYISDTRREGDGTKYLTPAESLPPSETEGKGKLDVLNNCWANIPTTYSGYINRSKLEEDLKTVLMEVDRYPIVTLKGSGGIGKTSLAIAVLQEISKTDRYGNIFWFSSRDIDLKMEGPKPVKSNILNQEDVANEFVNLLEKFSLTKSKERIEYLSRQMTKSDNGNSLFVFDNFETVANPSEFFTWLDTFIRNPNKILITSRSNATFKADYPIEVSGMQEFECRELIEKTSKSIGVNNKLTLSIVDDIIHQSYGHPYIIKILVGELAKDNKLLNIRKIVASKDEILTALFRRTYEWISPTAKSFLNSLQLEFAHSANCFGSRITQRRK